jgi:uncharacterized protein YndB with AHSA1/START domain
MGKPEGPERYSIRKSIVVGAPAEAVWQGLGSQEGLRAWLAEDMVIEPRLGGRVVFHAYGVELSGEVTAFEPPRLLAFGWNQTPPGWPVPTTLTVSVADEGEGTRVHLVHDGFAGLPANIRDEVFAGYVHGWEDDSDLIRLKELAEGQPAGDSVIVGSHAVFGPEGPTALQIRMQILIRAAQERVWEGVCTHEGLSAWLCRDLEFEPAVGGTVVLRGAHGGEPFTFSGQVEALRVPELLIFTWESDDTPFPVRSQLAIRLAAEEGGTRVHMYHQGFERLPEVAALRFMDFRAGWDGGDLAALKRQIEEAEVVR